MRRLWTLGILLCAIAVFAGDKNKDSDKDKSSDLKVTVVKAESGKPIRNAAVILHAVNSKGKQEAGGLNLKTDQEGVATYSGLPYGKLRVQVIVPGRQTYGQDFDIDEPQEAVVVKMEPPQKQYSIYDRPGAKPPQIDPDKH